MAKPPTPGAAGPKVDPPKIKPEAAKQTMDKALKMMGKNTFVKQLVTGTGAGVLSGLIVGSAGKAIALLLGSGLIALEVANHKGYTKKDLQSLQAQYRNTPNLQKVRTYVAKNKAFSSGFMGGFLIGMAF